MKYFEKTAFRYVKPGHIKKFNLFTEKEMASATMRHPLMKALFGVDKFIAKTEGKSEFGAVRKTYKSLAKKLSGRKAAGTIFPTPKGKSIAISKESWKNLGPQGRRNILAHEAFHANMPILGQSEILAHIYGGAKAGKTLKKSLKGATQQLGHAIRTRPAKVAIEAGLAAAGTAGAVIGTKKVKNKYFEKQR